MKTSAVFALIMLATPAAAQIQGGPNIAPNGMRFTFSPRFGYIGPPVGFVIARPPPQRYGPGAMPTIVIPAGPEPAPAPPVRRIEPPFAQVQPPPQTAPAPRLPGTRKHVPVLPCPDGCPREPDDPPAAQ